MLQEGICLTNILADNRFKILSGSALKMIAIISMAIDHSAVMLSPVIDCLETPFSVFGKAVTLYWIMRRIGRLAFPIFCFLIAEGYRHTRDKKRYGLRLLIFAVVSELPYNLLHSYHLFDLSGQNVFFTLFLGLLLIHIYESGGGQWKKFLLMAAVAVIAIFLKASYGLNGAVVVFVMYLFQNKPAAQALLTYPLLPNRNYALVAFIPINMYNGRRGFITSPLLKYAVYIFYPVHILILAGIRYLLQ